MIIIQKHLEVYANTAKMILMITTQSESFKSKIKITGKTPAAGNTKDVDIIVPLEYLSNFWRTFEMPLINCEVNLILTSSPTCAICSATGETKFKLIETKLYLPVVTLSTLDNAKLLQQLNPGFKRTINWNKYESNITTFAQNRYLNHLFNQLKFSRSKQTFCIIF